MSFVPSCPFLLQFCLSDQWLWAMLVLALPLTCKDFSGLSRNLMRLWIGDGEIPKFLANVCLETFFLQISVQAVFPQSGIPGPILAWGHMNLS